MDARWVAAVAAVALTCGCAHSHRGGRPPSADEIDNINRSASGDPGSFTIHYLDPFNPCNGGTCSPEGRPVSDTPPFEIERIVSADPRQLTVVAQSGDVWRLDLSQVVGVTTRRPATLAGSLIGGSLGLGVGTLFALMLSGRYLEDAPVSSYGQSSSRGAAIAAMAVFTAIGAIIGGVAGHASLTSATFDFGDTDRAPGPPTFSR